MMSQDDKEYDTIAEAIADAKKPRVFVYEGHEYEDPGQHLSNEDVRDILARTFGALAGGIIETTEQDSRIVVHLKPRPERKAGRCNVCDGPVCDFCGGCFEEGQCGCFENVIDDAMLVEWAEANREKLNKFAEMCRQRPGVDALELFYRVFELPATAGVISLD
jgi:hypothetical protein